MLRPGFVQRVPRLLHLLRSYEEWPHDQFTSIDNVPSAALMNLLVACGYVKSLNAPQLTPRGMEASYLAVGEPFSHVLIKDYMRNAMPNWAGVVRQGRRALASYADAEVLQCFEEAGLLDESSSSALWWDEMFLEQRGAESLERLRLGRKGEEKSFRYETERVGAPPEWVSIHQPTSPYDLLSFTTNDHLERLVIEVKASSLGPHDAHLYISCQEWLLLSTSRNAVLHLWANVENDCVEPYIVSPSALQLHIPDNMGSGRWESARVPFKSVVENSAES